ncbi:NUDIX hydrolase [Azospirillum picis]|uniref:8-oxo-dGTP pyrophosphatase MutT (NUDIX family) n=1 Tax=Azospirillum picis TaxID=488438 RepID=A0ABU0MJ90_9PROT|nr:NUDIX hydrolase [Azospirillum picis]MBP2299707.1 8-oxo-dGTP pyrophosphatase MutT (NUDIX family) [Azospirillum picis]MDQ0533503.1 8-oxo-dGTP pyrophosphatase MutT (NUDIX family) [Azospirillum picis]
MSTEKIRTQCAALPYRFLANRVEVLLITSRETRRWIVPKGWTEKKVRPRDMAAREAFEEAGVRGKVSKHPAGTYRYQKRLAGDRSVECEVVVYLLDVREELAEWPEQHERERCWMSPEQAAEAISESGLVPLLLDLGNPAASVTAGS